MDPSAFSILVEGIRCRPEFCNKPGAGGRRLNPTPPIGPVFVGGEQAALPWLVEKYGQK